MHITNIVYPLVRSTSTGKVPNTNRKYFPMFYQTPKNNTILKFVYHTTRMEGIHVVQNKWKTATISAYLSPGSRRLPQLRQLRPIETGLFWRTLCKFISWPNQNLKWDRLRLLNAKENLVENCLKLYFWWKRLVTINWYGYL